MTRATQGFLLIEWLIGFALTAVLLALCLPLLREGLRAEGIREETANHWIDASHALLQLRQDIGEYNKLPCPVLTNPVDFLLNQAAYPVEVKKLSERQGYSIDILRPLTPLPLQQAILTANAAIVVDNEAVNFSQLKKEQVMAITDCQHSAVFVATRIRSNGTIERDASNGQHFTQWFDLQTPTFLIAFKKIRYQLQKKPKMQFARGSSAHLEPFFKDDALKNASLQFGVDVNCDGLVDKYADEPPNAQQFRTLHVQFLFPWPLETTFRVNNPCKIGSNPGNN